MSQTSTQAVTGSTVNIIFDQHISNVTCDYGTWTESGQSVISFFSANTVFNVTIESGYVLNTVEMVSSDNKTIETTMLSGGASFTIGETTKNGATYTITITTKQKQVIPTKNINARITLKHDTAEHWALATNFIPKAGEFILYDPDSTYDFTRVKVGDGATAVADLPFLFEKLIELETNLGSYLAFLVKGE